MKKIFFCAIFNIGESTFGKYGGWRIVENKKHTYSSFFSHNSEELVDDFFFYSMQGGGGVFLW
jgi:hypothetical protein